MTMMFQLFSQSVSQSLKSRWSWKRFFFHLSLVLYSLLLSSHLTLSFSPFVSAATWKRWKTHILTHAKNVYNIAATIILPTCQTSKTQTEKLSRSNKWRRKEKTHYFSRSLITFLHNNNHNNFSWTRAHYALHLVISFVRKEQKATEKNISHQEKMNFPHKLFLFFSSFLSIKVERQKATFIMTINLMKMRDRWKRRK